MTEFKEKSDPLTRCTFCPNCAAISMNRPLAKVPITALVGKRLKVKGERKINPFTPCPLPLPLTSARSSMIRCTITLINARAFEFYERVQLLKGSNS